MQSSDPGHLFQTTSQLNQAADREKKLRAAEKIGEPINVSSKVLDLVIRGQEGWTAESGFQARRLDLRTGKTIKLYKGHQGPVTSVVLHEIKGEDGSKRLILFTGSWDKTIKIWDAQSGDLLHTLQGHTDFIKSLTVLPLTPPLLLSTSSDRTIRLWDISDLSSGAPSPRSIQTIKEHIRPVECSVYKVEVCAAGQPTGAISVWTGDSLGTIKRWEVDTRERRLVFKEDVGGHETSVAQLAVTDEGLWSVSSDKTAIFHSHAGPSSSAKPSVAHPSYVKSLLPIPEDFALPKSLVLTGSEDEDIRLYDVDSIGEVGSSAKHHGTIRGHCGEVSVLRAWYRDEEGKKGWYVVSGGLDSTLRRWSVQDLLDPPVLDYEPEEVKESVGLTEEEEQELAELMSEED
ncbi:cytoplasmic protein [Kwoniella heveanensis CBS 569]|nr:cytoplasmic protein [Kwoniella heveanensis CBS 569]